MTFRGFISLSLEAVKRHNSFFLLSFSNSGLSILEKTIVLSFCGGALFGEIQFFLLAVQMALPILFLGALSGVPALLFSEKSEFERRSICDHYLIGAFLLISALFSCLLLIKIMPNAQATLVILILGHNVINSCLKGLGNLNGEAFSNSLVLLLVILGVVYSGPNSFIEFIPIYLTAYFVSFTFSCFRLSIVYPP